ncbi:hypothetical protein HYH03_013220 [Edaphochlamys debaryana]|uniref:Activator of Hsp90 ATPase AHSA1-like N-terminal domain-containing protein n=1 Tax=Edaphochlamys debaryana TaxID=47281 RepID=A0A835XRE7_9CHLO|nr:hypothetical protein HYH03_013220 [Edaphochlamys debaryana]|eukprot:KAG2488227.1 hypothetical protein HYH03_013220 [Edaphochlamys debaryana]
MAKFDEADPRWLVKDMGEQGRNVNNWHWSERDVTDWAKHRLGELLGGVTLTAAPAAAASTGLESVGGEAFLNIRKGKMIASYDLEIRVGWKGELTDGEGRALGAATGKLHLPHVGDDNHDEDPEVRIVTDSNSPEAERLKAAIHANGKRPLLDAIHVFVKELRAGGPVLTETDNGQPSTANGTDGQPSSAANGKAAAEREKEKLREAAAAKAAAAEKKAAARAEGKIKLESKFHCRPQDLFECFVVQGRVCAFTQSPATVQPSPGGAFSWYGGAITGTFEELQPPHRIAMCWRFNTWPEDCSSKVVIEMTEPEPGNTVLKITQTGIPPADKFGTENTIELTETGWHSQVLQRIRHVFGYGV